MDLLPSRDLRAAHPDDDDPGVLTVDLIAIGLVGLANLSEDRAGGIWCVRWGLVTGRWGPRLRCFHPWGWDAPGQRGEELLDRLQA